MEKHERLRAARIAAGFSTAADAARAHGWNPTAYRHHENGTAGFQRQVEDYARAYKVLPAWLLFGTGAGPGTPRTPGTLRGWDAPLYAVPVLGEVAAGVWREARSVEEHDADEFLPISIPGYDASTLYALRVSGPSMNMYYPDGRFVIVAPAADVGIREGDHVVVRRSRAGLVETTIKEVVKEADRVALMPRSTDPAFQEAIYIGGQEGDQDAPVIMAVVVADYARRDRSAAALFMPGAAIR